MVLACALTLKTLLMSLKEKMKKKKAGKIATKVVHKRLFFNFANLRTFQHEFYNVLESVYALQPPILP